MRTVTRDKRAGNWGTRRWPVFQGGSNTMMGSRRSRREEIFEPVNFKLTLKKYLDGSSQMR